MVESVTSAHFSHKVEDNNLFSPEIGGVMQWGWNRVRDGVDGVWGVIVVVLSCHVSIFGEKRPFNGCPMNMMCKWLLWTQ